MHNWLGENCLLVPPVVLVPRVLHHLSQCKAKGTLVVPWWPSSVFWPLLWSCFHQWIQEVIVIEDANAVQLGRNKNSLIGSHKFNSPICAVRIDASQI